MDKGTPTPKGMNDDADGLLSGDPKVTCEAPKGMDASFNDKDDIGDDTQSQDAGDVQGTGSFNDNAAL